MELIRKHKIYFAVSEGYKDYLCSGTTAGGSDPLLQSKTCTLGNTHHNVFHHPVYLFQSRCMQSVE